MNKETERELELAERYDDTIDAIGREIDSYREFFDRPSEICTMLDQMLKRKSCLMRIWWHLRKLDAIEMQEQAEQQWIRWNTELDL